MDEKLRRHLGELAGLQPVVVPQQGVVEMKQWRHAYDTRRLVAGDEKAPELTLELTLRDENCDIGLCLVDTGGNVVAALEYTLASRPKGLELDLLRGEWNRRRRESAASP